MSPSVIREILELSGRPDIISLAGGLPSPDLYPGDAMHEVSERVLLDGPNQALQDVASEGYGPLREWVAAHLVAQKVRVQAAQVLITTGSHQSLEIIGKALLDAGSRVAVESPTSMSALHAFAPYEPEYVTLTCGEQGPLPHTLQAVGGARFVYVRPNFRQSGERCMPPGSRFAFMAWATALGLPVVEDNRYADLWFDAPPPAPMAAHFPEGVIYLGSFSRALTPGLRLGYVVAPRALFPKLLAAKRAAGLRTPGFNQRVVYEAIRSGLLDQRVPHMRWRHRAQRDAMAAALRQHLPSSCRWTVPTGGMFFWLELPRHVDATELLPYAAARGVAFVPGAAFHAAAPKRHMVRLSFVNETPARIERGIAQLALALEDMEWRHACAAAFGSRSAVAAPAPGLAQARPGLRTARIRLVQ
jgi:2-aminoadipate transaminase